MGMIHGVMGFAAGLFIFITGGFLFVMSVFFVPEAARLTLFVMAFGVVVGVATPFYYWAYQPVQRRRAEIQSES